MKRPAFKAPPYLKRPTGQGRLGRALLLALAVHAVLGALLFVGIRWKTKLPEPESAELFTPPPVAVRPPDPPPLPEPKAEPKPEPKPEVKPEPKAEIETDKRRETPRKDEKKAEPRKDEKKESRKDDKPEPKKPDKKEEPKPDKPRETPKKDSDRKADTQKDDAKREEFVKSMVAKAADAAGKSTTPAAGAAPTLSAATDRGYGAKVAAALKARTNYQVPDDLSGNPEALFVVKLRPDCGIIGVELKKSSGVAAWDQAAERGIRLTNPFPAMSNGQCDAVLEIGRSPKD